jgi:thioredoxin-like negative regulator of GroEL
MIMVNCGGGTDSDKKVMSKYKVEGYPTILVFEDGKPTEYNGKRSKEDFIAVFS